MVPRVAVIHQVTTCLDITPQTTTRQANIHQVIFVHHLLCQEEVTHLDLLNMVSKCFSVTPKVVDNFCLREFALLMDCVHVASLIDCVHVTSYGNYWTCG